MKKFTLLFMCSEILNVIKLIDLDVTQIVLRIVYNQVSVTIEKRVESIS